MAVKKETYSQAMERLEKIVRQIDNNELDIDILRYYFQAITSRFYYRCSKEKNDADYSGS